MLTSCNIQIVLAAGLFVLVGTGNARDAKSAAADGSIGHGAVCPAARIAPPGAVGDARVIDFARLLHGTWVRRLIVDGKPVETNSFWYIDMSDAQAGRGQAMMIDRINQGPDTAGRVAKVAMEVPATTGAYWSVSVTPAPAEAASQGHPGVTLAMAGDYRGTGSDYPPHGFRFTETGTFYRHGAAYATLHPWHAPPQATPPTGAGVPSAAESLIDSVVVTAGGVDTAGNGQAAQPTLTFIACQDGVVDRYVKIDDAVPVVAGKPLKAAWDAALLSGMFQAVRTR